MPWAQFLGGSMNIAARTKKIAVIAALVSLCALVTGCVSDMGATTADGQGSQQLRYYGGPKYPMWAQ